jgi:hypothetical protein
MRRAGCRVALLASGRLPVDDASARSTSVWSRLRGLRGASLARAIFVRLPPFLLGAPAATVIIAGGEQSLAGDVLVLRRPTTDILWTHALDYDLYLATGPRTTAGRTRSAVFVDQFLTDHPDSGPNGEPACDPATYFVNLRRLFDEIEQRLNLAVVIAAHPRSDYSANDARFGGRPVLHNRTVELVRDSALVITHYSTAISFVVLYGRPLLLTLDDGMLGDRVGTDAARSAGSWLGAPVVNLDHERVDWDSVMSVDSSAYERYRRAFLKTPGTPELPIWQQFADYLRRLDR